MLASGPFSRQLVILEALLQPLNPSELFFSLLQRVGQTDWILSVSEQSL